MSAELLLVNVLAWWVQVACITALGAVLAAVVRIDAAPVRYVYWRALLLLCLALPLVQGREPIAGLAPAPTAGVPAAAADAVVGLAAPVADLPQVAATPVVVEWVPLLAAVVAGIAAVRLLWLAISLLRLRRLRRAGEPAGEAAVMDVQWMLGAYADIRYVPGLKQPVTFGWRRPVILLPDTLRDHPDPIQRAVLCHELFHVKRGDWAWLLAEEAVRAALWFHPAAWWLVSRIQLAREEVVDELTVLATGRRRTYIEALLAFADETPLAPAPAFARKRHLFRRMMLISKEAMMSGRRVVWSCAVMALVLGAGVWYTASAFPLAAAAARVAESIELPSAPAAAPQVVGGLDVRTTPGPLEQKSRPITADNPVPRRRASAPAPYPAAAEAAQARAMVMLRATVDGSGRIAEVRRMNATTTGPASLLDAFVDSAVIALQQWQYDPPADAPITLDVNFSFMPDLESAMATQGGGGRSGSAGVSTAAGAAAGRSGGVAGGVPGVVVGGVQGGVAGGVAGSVTPPAPNQPIRVGGAIKAPTRTVYVPPDYPPIAQSARVQGVVIAEVLVGADGRTQDVRILRSIPLLDQAAINAVRQWGYTPTLLNGQPVPIIMTVTVQFTLPEPAPAPAAQ